MRVLAERYRLGDELGRGAAGVVYRATDIVLDRPVAVKLIGRRCDELNRDRLLMEARAAAALRHPSIVAVHDAGEDGDTSFIVMELVEGPNLRQAPPRDWDAILALARQVTGALDHAHGRGLIHRDLKPENILLEPGPAPVARLADFSVARFTARDNGSVEGSVVGTPHYLAPEQALGESVDGRADLYSLGAVLYELITGRPPFAGADPLVVIAEHLHAPVVPPRTWRPDVPRDLEAFVLRLLAKDPADRPPSAAAALAALEAVSLASPEGPGGEASDAPPLLSQLARGRLVGRRDELKRARDHFNRAMAGERQVVLISGEPGVGKSRLAQELLTQARLTGARVLKGGSYEFEAATPYLPFVEALRAFVAETDDALLLEWTAEIAPELARLAPEIASRLGPFPPPPSLPPAEEKLRLYDAVLRLLRRLAADRGLVLFLDDLHWADQGTLALVHYLLRQLSKDRVLLLGAYREVELDRAHPLAAALVEWNRERLATRIALDRLSAEDTGILLATLFGQESVSAEFTGAIYRETEGNPFFLEEVVKALIEQGQIYRRGAQWFSDTAENLAIPQSVKEAIGRRLDRLSEACLDTLHVAAAIGKSFRFDALAAATGRSEDSLLDELDEATAAQLLRPGRGDEFVFTHDKIREVLYGEMNPIRRRRQHARIFEALERLHAANPDCHATELAHHAVLSADFERGFQWSMRAVAQAEAVHAHDEARRFARQAEECAEGLGSDQKRLDALLALANVEGASGGAAAAAAALERALPLVPDDAKRAALLVRIAEALSAVGEERGRRRAEEALRLVDRERNPDDAARALMAIGRFDHYALAHRRAITGLEDALVLARAGGDPSTITTTMSFLAGAYQHLARVEESLTWARRILAFGEERGFLPAQALGHEFLSENYAISGDVAHSLRHAAENRRIGVALGARNRQAWSTFTELYCHWIGGNLAAARDAGEAGLALATEIGETRLVALLSAFHTRVLVDDGDEKGWPVMADQAARIAGGIGQPWMSFLAAATAAWGHLARGEAERALALLEPTAFPGAGDNGLIPIDGLLVHGRAFLLLDRIEDASAAAEELHERTRTAPNWFHHGLALRLRAEIAIRMGRLDEARADLDRAVETADTWNHRLELARHLNLRAALHDRAGRSADAHADRERSARVRRHLSEAASAV
jgi:tetratricopeptide (TPR) repeat protein